jgi:hypothetical protein
MVSQTLKDSALELPTSGIQALINDLGSIDTTDQKAVNERTKVLSALAKQNAFPSLAPLLPLVLNLNGKLQ